MTSPPDRFTATPNPVSPGQTLTIGFTDDSKAGKDVEVTVATNLGDTTLTIKLDESGHGTVSWDVPTGTTAIGLEGPDSADHVVEVT